MKYIVLQPSFYDKFECIGSACKMNCCTHFWRIDFTKEEFRNIKRRIKTEEFIFLLFLSFRPLVF